MKINKNKSGITLRKWKDKVMWLITLFFLCMKPAIVHANSIESSNLGKGLKNLFNDASAYLLVLSPIIGGLFALYFLIRKNAADEQDQKQWNKRLIITGICVVGAVLVSGTINVITGYFK